MSAPLQITPDRKFLEEEVPFLLEGLSDQQIPHWGKMTAQQMVEHVAGILLMSTMPNHGNPVVVPEERLEKAIAWLESGKQFRPNTVAPILPPDPLPLRFADLQEAKEKCMSAIEKYLMAWQAKPDMIVDHPAFGPLNRRQWEKFHVKHFRHHFRQFGLIPLPTDS